MVIVDKSYLVSARINLGQYFNVPEEDAFIELREPSTFDALKMEKATKAGDTEATLKTFSEILPRVIVDHNFYKDKDSKLEPEDVVAMLAEKLDLYSYVVGEYSTRVLFTLGSKSAAKSNGSPAVSSEAK